MILAVFACAQSASAQFSPTISLGGEFMKSVEADFKGDSGNSMSIQQATTDLSYFKSIGENSSLILALSASKTEYDFEEKMPWKEVNQTDATFILDHGFGGKWSLMGLGFVRSAYSTEADFEDGFTWGAAIGGKYQKSDTFSYIVGVAYLSRLEDSGLLIPFAGFEWQINERLMLDGMMGLTLNYDLSGDGSSVLGFGLDYSMEDFRLEKDAVDATQRAVRPEGFGCFLSYTQQFGENFSIILKIRGIGEQEYRTMADGHEISSFKTEPTLFYGAGLNITF
jgi:hypothetical protein